MRLKNKKTGQLGNFIINKEDYFECVDLDYVPQYRNLAELNEEWEDYEEPKECEYWYIEADGQILQCHKPKFINHLLDKQKAIGNYFETKEEAEKAVEKLKAWKRLKDKGFEFGRWDGYVNTSDGIGSGDHFDCCGFVNAYGQIYNNHDSYAQYRKDLDLLFGGEE